MFKGKYFVIRYPKNLSHSLSIGIAFILSIIAIGCAGPTTESVSMNEVNESRETTAPLRNLNPAPRQSYEIRIVLKDAPGPFEVVNAAAQYDVANAAQCGKPQPLSGAIPRISSSEVIELTKLSDTEYAGTVYIDQILDEDYYDRGTCHWKFVEVRVGLRASDDPMATSFVAAINSESILQQGSGRRFFSSVHFPNAQIENYANFGHETLDHVSEVNRNEFFLVEMSARSVGQ